MTACVSTCRAIAVNFRPLRMDIYFAAVFTDLVRHSAVWNTVSRDTITSAIAEYRYLSQTLASQYGRRHENFTGDGHLYLFESADVAVHFSLKLIAYWKQRRRHLTAGQANDLPIRVGCHFGECSRMHDDDAWIGRALNIAKRVESCAEPDTLFVTQTILILSICRSISSRRSMSSNSKATSCRDDISIASCPSTAQRLLHGPKSA